MSPVGQTVAALNSGLRTLLALITVGIFGTAGWFGYNAYVEPGRRLDLAEAELEKVRVELGERDERIRSQSQKITKLNEDIQEKIRQITRLETSLRLLKVDHRIAELRVLDQQDDPDSDHVLTTVEFVEINEEGAPIDDPKRFEIEGDIVYIEAKVVQFRDEYVEQADADRSSSLCLFQRIWGEYQQPSQGFPIDETGTRPTAYARGGVMSDFEKSIWENFWQIANDRALANSLGVRTSNLEVPGMKVEPGMTYRITLRASGGLSILPPQKDDTDSAAPPSPGA